MRGKLILAVITLVCPLSPLAGCGSEREGDETPGILRARFETEMKAILHDLQAAEEQAAALEGRYVSLEELRGKYLNRHVPESYTLTVSELTRSGYRAEIVHGPTGLRCSVEVGAAAPGRGSPRCV